MATHSALERISSALERVSAGVPVASGPLLPINSGEDLLSCEDWVEVGVERSFTARELSVAILLFEGKTRRQIARQLHCAPGTVRVYIDRLFAKLSVEDRVGMVLRVVRIYLARRHEPLSH